MNDETLILIRKFYACNRLIQNGQSITKEEREILFSDEVCLWVLSNDYKKAFSDIYTLFSIPYKYRQKVKKIIIDVIFKYKGECVGFEDFDMFSCCVLSELSNPNSAFINEEFHQEIFSKISKYQCEAK